MSERIYLAIDLKSFYASVECLERSLDPMGVNLVVADQSRTEKTICLSVSPSLKEYGVPGRPRLFEVIQRIREVNRERKRQAPMQELTGSSWMACELRDHPELAVDYLVAPPQMAQHIAARYKGEQPATAGMVAIMPDAIVMATMAAVSVRKILLPREITSIPRSLAARISSSAKPPSGPMKMLTDFPGAIFAIASSVAAIPSSHS